MSNNLYICQNLGLGDHIITNAIIRKLSKQLNKILFVRECNYESVKFMFRDISSLSLALVKDEYNMMKTVNEEKLSNTLVIGLMNLKENEYFDKSFYKELGVDFNLRWSGFYVERDKKRENLLLDKLGLKNNEDYIFVHDDKERNFTIKDKLLPSNIKIVKPDRTLTENIFDYLAVIEKAKEIHVISSSFMFLIDSFESQDKLFMHHYARYNPCYRLPHLKKDWVIFN